jgi:accessory gene regulator protein AgrB
MGTIMLLIFIIANCYVWYQAGRDKERNKILEEKLEEALKKFYSVSENV